MSSDSSDEKGKGKGNGTGERSSFDKEIANLPTFSVQEHESTTVHLPTSSSSAAEGTTTAGPSAGSSAGSAISERTVQTSPPPTAATMDSESERKERQKKFKKAPGLKIDTSNLAATPNSFTTNAKNNSALNSPFLLSPNAAAENTSYLTAKSPTSSFFSKIHKSGGGNSGSRNNNNNNNNTSDNLSWSGSSVPSKRRSKNSKGSLSVNEADDDSSVGNRSVESFHSSNLLEDADIDVLDKGLTAALGSGGNENEGMWLPVSSPRSAATGSGSEDIISSTKSGNETRSNIDEPEQEGIKLDDLRSPVNLKVPSYPEYLMVTTSSANNHNNNNNNNNDNDNINNNNNNNNNNVSAKSSILSRGYSDNENHVRFPGDLEHGLKIREHEDDGKLPSTTPRRKISIALKKFTARFNGKDDNDEQLLGINSNQKNSTSFDYNSTDEPLEEESVMTFTSSRQESPASEEDTFSFNSANRHTINEPNEINTNINNTNRRYSGLEGIRLFGNSLKYFGPRNRLRLRCASIILKNWFDPVVLQFTLLQTVVLVYQQWNPYSRGYVYNGKYTWVDWVLVFVNVFYTIEVMMKIITFGLVDDSQMYEELNLEYKPNVVWEKYFKWTFKRLRNRTMVDGDKNLSKDIKKGFNLLNDDMKIFQERPKKPVHSVTLHNLKEEAATGVPVSRAFLRSSWNRVDFVSTLSFWLSFFLSFKQYDLKHHITLFRSLMCLRILRLTNLTHGTLTILRALKKAAPELVDISFFIISFWIFFAIIGVQSFKSSLRRQCVWYDPDDPSDYYVNDFQFCGSYIDATTSEAKAYIFADGTSSGEIKGYRCPVYSKCVSNTNPYGNTMSFDNIANSFELVFVVMSANTFTDIMYYTMDSDTLASSLFFIFGVFFLTVWLVNLLVAVIVTAFKITRDEISEQQKLSQKKKVFSIKNWKKEFLYNDLKKKLPFLKWYYKFEWVFLLIIVVDLIVQCTRNENSSSTEIKTLYKFESAVTLILLFEIVLRFCCFLPHWRNFFYSRKNIFDLFLAVITSIIVIPIVHSRLGHAYFWLTAFQISRFYRVVLFFTYTKNTWIKVLGNFRTVFDLSLFYFIFLFLVSVIMSRFFEGIVPESEMSDNPLGMYTLPNVFISLYTVTSTENWSSILYIVQQYAKNKSAKFFGAAYIIMWFIFSNFIILNIFIAVIAENLEISETDKRNEQIQQYLKNLKSELTKDPERSVFSDFKERITLRKNNNVTNAENTKEEILYLLLNGKVKGFNKIGNEKEKSSSGLKKPKIIAANKWISKVPYYSGAASKIKVFYDIFRSNPFFSSNASKAGHYRFKDIQEAEEDLGTAVRGIIDRNHEIVEEQTKYLQKNPSFNTVFYLFPPNHRVRKACQKLVPSSYGDRIDGVEPNKAVSDLFSIIMFLVTVAMVIMACYTTPLYRKEHDLFDESWNWTIYFDLGFTLLFSFEFVIKVVADGLIFTPNAYLISAWNIIDAIVLISLWIDVIASLKNATNVSRIVNGFKALRALRLLSLSSRAKSTFQNTIISGFWKILGASTISLSLLLPFAIWGLNIFNGRLGYCLDGTSVKSECHSEYTNEIFKWDIVSPNVYVNPQLAFNSFFPSFLTLFEIVSLEGWVDLLENLMNSTGVGTVPSTFATPVNAIYIVLFNFLSIVFILTLFVSVIINNYSRTTGRAYLTSEQSAWYEVEKILKQIKASKRGNIDGYSKLKLFCHKLVVERNIYWRIGTNLLLIIHTLALLLEVYPTISGLDETRYIIYLMTSSAFLLSLFVSMYARGFVLFFKNKWNWFRFFVIFGAFSTSFISFFVSRQTVYANFNKLFLVGILFFIIPKIDRLNQLLRFASASLPSLLSLLFTWGILFLVFAIAMNQIFGLTRIGANTSNNINLRTVTKALILLFKMSFGEGWNYIMKDFAVQAPFCVSSDSIYDSDCGNEAYAYVLFISWNIVSMFIFLNMFVSLTVDSFSYVYHASGPHSLITRNEIRKFKECWLTFDPDGTGYIDPADLPKFLGSLNGVLSYKIYNDGRFSIRELKDQWFKDTGSDISYDIFIDFAAMESSLASIDTNLVKIRRLKFERLYQELLTDMMLYEEPGISFTRTILKIALYSQFEENKCLTLDDFMKRYVEMDKVDKELKKQKVYDTLKAVICRWRFKKGKFTQLVDAASSDFDGLGINFGEEIYHKPSMVFISDYINSEDNIKDKLPASSDTSMSLAKKLSNNNNGDNPFADIISSTVGPSVYTTFSNNPFSGEGVEEGISNGVDTQQDLYFRANKFNQPDRHAKSRTLTGFGNSFNSNHQQDSDGIGIIVPTFKQNDIYTSIDNLSTSNSAQNEAEDESMSLLSIDINSPRH
ncbi:hypothetical protein PACTADRAFT_47961 [Pachysolen tannophilus NRRL Y-2460]|uniref:Calcium-channel protein CCH1 n=1 Tax=Pachysolen tannophilus NRRL Y-2460 TaxID=669874 RepID=A0A1E4U2D3_PACTA|nr:hypothetical protein PACTADRAFT_47961 [Pachysolen tannophilus NRRL Y-2460]